MENYYFKMDHLSVGYNKKSTDPRYLYWHQEGRNCDPDRTKWLR